MKSTNDTKIPSKINGWLQHITPVYIACIIGIIGAVVLFFQGGDIYLAWGYLVLWMLLLLVLLIVDRFLVTKLPFKKLLVGEIIFLSGVVLWFLYATSYTAIRVHTSRSYFFVVYDTGGLKEKDIPRSGIFNRAIAIKTDSNIHVAYHMFGKAQIEQPGNWHTGYGVVVLDTVINGQPTALELYTNAQAISQAEKTRLFQQEVAKLK